MTKLYVVKKEDYLLEEVAFILQDEKLAKEYEEANTDVWVEEYEFADEKVREILAKHEIFYRLKVRIFKSFPRYAVKNDPQRHEWIDINKRNTLSHKKTKPFATFSHSLQGSKRISDDLELEMEIPLSNQEEERAAQKEEWTLRSRLLFEKATELFFIQKKSAKEIEKWMNVQVGLAKK